MYSNSVHLIDYLNFLCRGKLVKIKKNKVWNIKRQENFSVKMFFHPVILQNTRLIGELIKNGR